MTVWKRAVIQGVSKALVAVVVFVLFRGFSHGWDQLSRPDFWFEYAVVFLVLALLITGIDGIFDRPRP